MGDLIDFETREVIDRSVEAAPDDEGLSVFVVTDGKELAIQAAPMVARRLHPGVRVTDVLHVERAVGRHGENGFEVTLLVD